VGILGRKGACKSTPAENFVICDGTNRKETVKINGRVASLREVGIGFFSELTGRWNVYLISAVLRIWNLSEWMKRAHRT